MAVLSRLTAVGETVSTLAKAGFLTPMRPDRAVRMIAAARDEGLSITTGFATAAQRCPDNPGLIDELGTLTWRELDERCHALAQFKAADASANRVDQASGLIARHEGHLRRV